jgi:hypothetical protein
MREIEIVCASLAPLFDHVVLGRGPACSPYSQSRSIN